MKKLFFAIQGFFAYLSFAVPSFAATLGSVNPCDQTDKAANDIAKTLCKLGVSDVPLVIRNIIVLLIVIAVIIALIYLIYGGIKWIMSRGEKTEVEGARNHVISAIVGLIVVFLAIFIIAVVLAVFGVDFNQLQIPTITPK